ncbi:unnamed protein product [Adineta steineri]|uniref:Uncharacterized protein n=1 Tax=Adineta steineri TaxID=433720 RepID=A0A819ARQ9_9BILA|nr:unnamed protein product [Adineta steineri]
MTTPQIDSKDVQTDIHFKLLKTLQTYIIAVSHYRLYLFNRYTQSDETYEFPTLFRIRKQILNRFEWVIIELEQIIEDLQLHRLSITDVEQSINRPLIKEVIETALNADLSSIIVENQFVPSKHEWRVYKRNLQETKKDLCILSLVVHQNISRIKNMAVNKKQQIRGIRILLTVFYGFLLSSTLFRYVIHGIVETIRRPTNPYAIAMIVIGGLILISIFLATYATWFDNTVILLVSGVVLVFVFILTLVFGIIRIVKTAPDRTLPPPTQTSFESSDMITTTTLANDIKSNSDIYALAEDITKLIIELVFTLFAILATFALFRYVKGKYAAVPTREAS